MSTLHHTIDRAHTDARIFYPCFKSLDDYFDVQHLKDLNQCLSEKIRQYASERREEYFLNAHRLDAESPYQPGAREIWLTRPKTSSGADVYNNLHITENWDFDENAKDFAELMQFIGTLPFKSMSRILIIYDDAGTAVPAHRDHLNPDMCQEFIWFRTNLLKPFYMLNDLTNDKKYVDSYSAWFDAVNQFHGTDAVAGLSFSIRVDGHFSDDLRKNIPVPHVNKASTPALWATIGSNPTERNKVE